MRPLCLLLLLVLTTTSAFAQREVIVRWVDGQSALPPAGAEVRWLSPRLSIQLLTFADDATAGRAYKSLLTQSRVRAVSRNRPVSFRRAPNDPDYIARQDNLRRAGFETAWDLTTGGRTDRGKEIVVAILDDGFDVTHPDLRDNLWRNPGETIGDQIDNDGNGFTDDEYGWNFNEDRRTFSASSHGTQVAGVLGAKGNNEQGISGTNWDLRMMLFSIRDVADVIGAYNYILDQRLAYNRTDGREGAFVVATNASFGVEGVDCDEFPVWRDLYDELGAAGVLTAGSTANRSWNVDLNGDTPTTCPSDYLLGVTNVGADDRLDRGSGFGPLNVDLAAQGEGSWTTRPQNGYGVFGSTSAAAPLVSGAIALLYASPFAGWEEQVERDPAGAALLVRQALLEGVTERVNLADRTVTGGTLDVAEAQRRLADLIGDGSASDFAIESLGPNPADDFVKVSTTAAVLGGDVHVEVHDALGRRASVEWGRGGGGTLFLETGHLRPGWYSITVREGGRAARAAVVIH